MPEYVCPNCRGGFPDKDGLLEQPERCPWCETHLDGSHDPQPRVSVVRSDDDEPEGLIERLFG